MIFLNSDSVHVHVKQDLLLAGRFRKFYFEPETVSLLRL